MTYPKTRNTFWYRRAVSDSMLLLMESTTKWVSETIHHTVDRAAYRVAMARSVAVCATCSTDHDRMLAELDFLEEEFDREHISWHPFHDRLLHKRMALSHARDIVLKLREKFVS